MSIEEAIKHPVFDEIRDQEAENFEEKNLNYDFEDQKIKTEKQLRQLYIKEIFGKK